MDQHEEFVAKHAEVLALRRRVEALQYELSLVEGRLRTADRESSVLFHNLFVANGKGRS